MDHRRTDKTRRVIELAQSAAHRAGLREFGAEYVLIGIAHYGDQCVASAILRQSEVSLDGYLQQFGQRRAEVADPTCQLSDTFLDLARTEAQKLNHEHIGTEHLLLAIARSASPAAEYLRVRGGDYARLRDQVVALLGKPA